MKRINTIKKLRRFRYSYSPRYVFYDQCKAVKIQ